MRKYFIILIVIGICISEECSAQSTDKLVTKTPNTNVGKKNLTIRSDEECSLVINGKNHGLIRKGKEKTIALPVGTHKLVARKTITEEELKMELNLTTNKTLNLKFKELISKKEQMLDSIKTADSIKGPIVVKTDSVKVNGENVGISKETRSKEQATVDALFSSMVEIDGGSFIMGSNIGYLDESPEHTVTVPAIQFAKYEVTQQQWESIMGSNPSNNQGCVNCPVENISWEDIALFINKINQVSNKKFRLPTEAEWEYIVEKGAEVKDLKEIAWYRDNSNGTTHAVGTKQPNAFGIYDLLGNVAELCNDWYKFNYYKSSIADKPSGPPGGKDKVVRGGSYDVGRSALRLSYRDKHNSTSKDGMVGFRLVMDLAEAGKK